MPASYETTTNQRLFFPGLGGFYSLMAPVAYAILRVGVGISLFTHGWPKITHSAHGKQLDPFSAVVNLINNFLHLPYPEAWTYLVGYLEVVGGLALALGLLTRIFASALAIELAVVTCIIWPLGGFAWMNPGAEYAFVLGLILLYISFAGGGRFSVDRLFGREV